MITSGTVANAAANGTLLAMPTFCVDHVADEVRARSADERGGDEVAERQREGEDRARREARQDQRHEDRAKRAPAARPEIGRGLDVGVGHAFDRRPHRQDHERQPDVAEHDPHRPVGVADVHRAEAHVAERPVDDPVLGEYQPPRVHAHEVARPERDQHRHEQGALQPLGGDAVRRRRRMAPPGWRRSRSRPPLSRSCAARSSGRRAP